MQENKLKGLHWNIY